MNPAFTVTDPPGTTTATLDTRTFASGSPVTEEGDHLLVIESVDKAGNPRHVDWPFALDRTPPEITISGVTDRLVTRGPVDITWTATDKHLASASATLDGQQFHSGDRVEANGPHTLVVVATDRARHITERTVRFRIDRVAPEIVITAPAEGQGTAMPSVEVVATVTDDVAVASVTTQGVPVAPDADGTCRRTVTNATRPSARRRTVGVRLETQSIWCQPSTAALRPRSRTRAAVRSRRSVVSWSPLAGSRSALPRTPRRVTVTPVGGGRRRSTSTTSSGAMTSRTERYLMSMSTNKRALLAALAFVVALCAGVWWGWRRSGSTPEVVHPTSDPYVVDTGPHPSAMPTVPGKPGVGAAASGESPPAAAGGRDEGPPARSARADEQKAAALVAEGEKLIGQNSEDSVRTSVDELEMGIARVQEGLRLGYPDKAAAQRVLADAYHVLVNNSDATEEMRDAYGRAEMETYKTLVELEPKNPRWLERCAAMTNDPEQNFQAWRSVVARFPALAGTDLRAHHILEKRFAVVLGVDSQKMAAVAVSVQEHQVFTNAGGQLFRTATERETRTVRRS